MSISRIHVRKRENPYVQIDKATLNDKRLSFRAKGLHAYLLSKPDGWVVYVKHLVNESPREGRDAITSAMKELEIAGYIVRQKVRNPMNGQLMGWETIVYETPELASLDIIDSIPRTDYPESGDPVSGDPNSGNPHLVIKDCSHNGERLINEKDTHTAKPSVSEECVSGLINDWNKIPGTEGLPRVTEKGANNPTLRRNIALRFQEHDPDDEFWDVVLNKCWSSPFLRGEGKGGWRATLHWLVERDVNAIRVYEGHYDRAQ